MRGNLSKALDQGGCSQLWRVIDSLEISHVRFPSLLRVDPHRRRASLGRSNVSLAYLLDVNTCRVTFLTRLQLRPCSTSTVESKYCLPFYNPFVLFGRACPKLRRKTVLSIPSTDVPTFTTIPRQSVMRRLKEGDAIENLARSSLTKDGLLDTSKLAICPV